MSSRNFLLRISSLSCDSQLSCRVSISSASKSFCSGVSFSSHFALSNLVNGAFAGAPAEEPDEANKGATGAFESTALLLASLSSVAVAGEEVGGELEAGLADPAGEDKKEVIDALALGFLVALVARSAAFRLRGVVMFAIDRDKKQTNGMPTEQNNL